MHSSHATPDKCLRSANRGRDWILSLLDERGAIRGDGGIAREGNWANRW
jgi:hypothetical protein